MWNLFRSKPECPVDANQQQWIDQRFGWLAEQFGPDRPRSGSVILPTPEFFPDPFNGKEEDAQRMLNRIAGYMGVDAARLRLFVYCELDRPEVPAGGFRY